MAAALALLAIAVYAARLSPHERLARIGLALILGGAVGNLIDRADARLRSSTSSTSYSARWHFWAFNVADAAITVGVARHARRTCSDWTGMLPRTA
ncbi:MAG: signal peptidase II [Candidatus Moduliflexus flocculans]|nr:signal peptidase II [Candidatus Moduliflexus flocculans]